MKRYLLFAGHTYYPSGGRNDFKGDFDCIQDAVQWIEDEKANVKEYWGHLDWWHVVDGADFMIVKTNLQFDRRSAVLTGTTPASPDNIVTNGKS